jgi:phosphatidylglycerol:prolipoprotein diacylglycerol transferase
MRPVLFHVGGFAVSSFWTMAFLGFYAAFLVVRRDLVRRGYDAVHAYDMTLWAYVGGWVGARLFVIPSGWQYFTENPVRFLLSASGWVWYGGVIGGAAAVILWARYKRLEILPLADVVAPALAIGLAFGRIGCQLSGDGDYGIPSDLPWAMSYPDGVVPTTERVHPTPLYELAASLAIFLVLWRQRAAGPPAGNLMGQYLIYSGAARFLVEFVRRNPAWLGGLTTAQWQSVASVILGLLLLRHAYQPPPEEVVEAAEAA